jgi:serpin B
MPHDSTPTNRAAARRWLALAGLAALACGGAAGRPATAPERASDPEEPIVFEASAPTAPGAAEADRFAAATNAFASDLWRALREREGNLAISPASVEMALAMTWAGARGETAAQMAQVLRFGPDAPAFHRAAGHVLTTWNDPERETYRLAVANRLFGERSTAWREPFLALTADVYRAPLEPVDFRGAPEPARQRINGWVAERTAGRIRDLIPPGALDASTRLVLANAVHFLADWQRPFDAAETRDRIFHAPDGDRPVPTMHQVAAFGYAEADGLQLLEMPYAGGELAMLVALPEANDGLGALEAGLSAERLAGWVERLEIRPVRVALPKFRIEPDAPLALGDVLAGMGMPLAFDPRRADFTAMADRTAGPPLFLDAVFHEAFVAVDEEGTEAAAATAAVVSVTSATVPPPDAPELVADHPFLFFVRDVESGAILFMGRVTDPAPEG